ncbi:ferrous iron transport protein A [Alkalicella caledoniensis]|uniref:Ferrous iron transport protein A n=1 Tax=Alkalicella caledoniensis TaxID=2731377 RepID=A0A7G9WAE4_ALKCA|nr:ferrous iron transport protein A [Alkalicella caledoniensis]QNO15656.1 ferrous iron transport protein A [Alkalicella caledoniensis]
MLLTDCRKGDVVEIMDIHDNWAKEQVIRFGIVQGVKVTCVSISTHGPVVIKKNNQQIALGYQIAKEVKVKRGVGAWGRK